MGALYGLGLSPAAPPAPRPAPPRVNLLTRSLRELTRSLRGGLFSVPKGREAIATGVPQRGPGEEGQVQRAQGACFGGGELHKGRIFYWSAYWLN